MIRDPHTPRTEAPARVDGQSRFRLDTTSRLFRKEVPGQVHHCTNWRGDLEIIQKDGSEPSVARSAAMVGLLRNLTNIEVPIVALQKVGLRRAARGVRLRGANFEVNVPTDGMGYKSVSMESVFTFQPRTIRANPS